MSANEPKRTSAANSAVMRQGLGNVGDRPAGPAQPSERAKPAVPFGGKYRIIDFVLSNFVNSGINSIYVLTQFRSQSLLQHLSEGWQFGGMLKSHFIINVPAQMRSETESWYLGTADAIYQNINLIEQSDPQLVAIFGGDHIYRMNIGGMIDFHMAKKAEVSVAAIPVPEQQAIEFGVMEADGDGRIVGAVSVLRDLTERRRLEREHEEAQAGGAP